MSRTVWQSIGVAGLTLLVGMVPPAGAELYKWTDEQGSTHYSQTPPPSGEVETIKPPPPADPEAAREQLEQYRETLRREPDNRADRAQAARETAEIAHRNCAAARKNLDTYTRYRSVRNAEGELEVLTDEERLSRLRTAREMIEKYCK